MLRKQYMRRNKIILEPIEPGKFDVLLSSIERGGSGAASTKNIPHLHALGPQFCMYGKHAWPTCRITPILHVNIWRWGVLAQLVRKTYHIYMHSDPNSACTQNIFFVHAAILHVHIWPVSVSIIQRGGFWNS